MNLRWEDSLTKTFNLKRPVSRLPISLRVEMITPTLLKTIVKFCTTRKLFKANPIKIKNYLQCNKEKPVKKELTWCKIRSF